LRLRSDEARAEAPVVRAVGAAGEGFRIESVRLRGCDRLEARPRYTRALPPRAQDGAAGRLRSSAERRHPDPARSRHFVVIRVRTPRPHSSLQSADRINAQFRSGVRTPRPHTGPRGADEASALQPGRYFASSMM